MLELVVATPVFLDLTFVGLESLPALGEEKFAADMIRTPGGGAITAIGASRLGVQAAVAAPLGDDVAGDLVRMALADEGVKWVGTKPAPRTPTTVVMPFGGDRAMVTIDLGARASTADVAAHAPRAVAASLDQLFIVPDGSLGFITCGDDDYRAYAGRPPAALAGMHAIFLNAREATGLTDTSTVEDAGASLAQMADTVIITQASEGALQFHEGEITRYSYRAVDNPVDTTGAGDLLAAAYIWADLRGADPGDRLRWAVVYATLAVMSPSGIGGAVSEAELVRAGIEADLVPPPLAGAYAR
jgi:sugar/nucleoside kinase (ribokinase family)